MMEKELIRTYRPNELKRVGESIKMGDKRYATFRNEDGMFLFVAVDAIEMKNVRVVK